MLLQQQRMTCLRNKFWTGLKDDQLKNDSSHEYDTIKDFGELLKDY